GVPTAVSTVTGELYLSIGGTHVEGSGVQMTVISPVTGETLATGSAASPADVDRAVAVGVEALPALRKLGRDERCNRLGDAATILENGPDRWPPHRTLEQGKPITEARDEIAEAVTMLRRVAEDARRLADAPPPVADPNKRVLLYREPLGVVASVAPWNFPYVI